MKIRSAPSPPAGAGKLPSFKTGAWEPVKPPSPELERIGRHQRAAELARDAYLSVETLKARFPQPSFEFYEEDGFAFLAVMQDDETAAIAFRGTQRLQISNWRANAKFLFAGTPKRHRGFMAVWGLLRPAVLRWLRTHRPPRIVLSGHSLGGALAVLAAYDLAAEWAVDEVTVFGCPRVGTPGFASDYAARGSGTNTLLGDVTTRYVHSTDVISRLPPPFLWYRHVGQPVYVNAEGVQIYYPSPYFMRVLETALDPATLRSPDSDRKAARSTQIIPPDVSALSALKGQIVPVLAGGLIPVWALCALVSGLVGLFIWRDLDYFHDSEKYVGVMSQRRVLLERSPLCLPAARR